MSKIERLVISNYRGASSQLSLELDKSKQVIVLFGENGTGKTTIADALDAVGNNSKGSLGEKSSTKPSQHLPTIGKKPQDISIELHMAEKIWKTTLSKDTLSTIPQPSPKIRVLRRKHLQQLIEAEPANRYLALKQFIDVGKVEQSENTLKEAASIVKSEYDEAVRLRGSDETQLQSVWEAEGKPNVDAMNWASAIAIMNVSELDQEALTCRNIIAEIQNAERALINYKNALESASLEEEEVKVVEQEVAKMPGLASQSAISLSAILRQVSNHLKLGTHPDECPVCMQQISIVKLKSELESRLLELKPFEMAGEKQRSVTQSVQLTQKAIEPKITELITVSKVLYERLSQSKNAIVLSAGINYAVFNSLSKDNFDDKQSQCEQAALLINLASPLKSQLEDAAIENTKTSGQVNSIRELSERVKSGVENTEQLEILYAALNKAYNIARLARIEYTQKILDDVVVECNRLYGLIHPDEPIAISKLELDQNKRASLNQAATFEGFADVPPQAYFSESHLDTLGFCFWLAISKLENPEKDSILVIDDAFSSVDAPHISRIAQLIMDESKNFSQVIITTHQRLWRDIYKYAKGPGNLVQLIELQRWSLAKGISNYKTKLAVVELTDTITAMPFDRQISASKAGILLEALLDQLALQYRCRVARTPDNSYTLGELLDGTTTLFKALEIHRPKIDSLGVLVDPLIYESSTVTELIKKIGSISFVRNQVGAHFNISGSDISDNEVADFAELAIQLADALSCGVCGQMPNKKTTTHYHCSCASPGELRMLPLQV